MKSLHFVSEKVIVKRESLWYPFGIMGIYPARRVCHISSLLPLHHKKTGLFSPVFGILSCFSGSQILADHQCHLEDDGVVELAQIQAGELLDLF